MIVQIDSPIDPSHPFPLLFEKLPEVNQEGSQWTDCEINDAIKLVYQNLNKLDSYISLMVRASTLSLCSSILVRLEFVIANIIYHRSICTFQKFPLFENFCLLYFL